MAAFVTSGTYDSGSSSLASHDFTVDCSTGGSNRLLVVKVFQRNPSTEITSATADGNAMTSQITSENAGVCGVRIYTYTAPDDSVAVSIGTSSFKILAATWELWDGVDQTTPVEATGTGGTFTTTFEHGTVSLTNGAYISSAVNTQNTRTITIGNGITTTQDFDPGSTNLGQAYAGYKYAKLASDVGTGLTLSSGDNYRFAAVAIKPSTAATNDTMSSPFFGGQSNATTSTGSYYQPPNGSKRLAASLTLGLREVVFPTITTLSSFRVDLTAAPGSGKSREAVLFRNGVATSMAVTISDTATNGTYSTNAVTFYPGDTAVIRNVATGTPAASNMAYSFIANAMGQPVITASHFDSSNPSTSVDNYETFHGAQGRRYSTGTTRTVIVPTAGTISKLYVVLSSAPGAAKSYAFTIRKNGTDTSLTATVSGTTATASDTSNSFSVAAGDDISIKVTPSGTPTATSSVLVSVLFEPTTSGESFFGASQPAPSTSATNYAQFIAPAPGPGVDSIESNAVQTPGDFTIKKMYVAVHVAPSSGKSWAFTARKNAADSGLAVTIANTDTTGNATADVDFALGDTGAIKVVPTSTPTDMSTGFNASILISTASSGTTVTPGIATLTLTAQTPTVETTGSIAITTAAPASLTLTAQTPTLTATNNIAITTASPATLTLTAQTPTVTAGASISVTPGTASLTITAQTPTVTATANIAITTAAPSSLTITRQTPTATVSNNQSATPGTASLTLTAQTPTVDYTTNATLTPGVVEMVITMFAPSVVLPSTDSPIVIPITVRSQPIISLTVQQPSNPSVVVAQETTTINVQGSASVSV